MLERGRRALLLLAILAGCGSDGGGIEALEARYPSLAGLGAHPLADTRPYYLPAGGELTLFLCRWPDAAVIPVALPVEASPDELRKLRAALAAWQGAGLGLVFEERDELRGAGIELLLRDGMIAYAANTIVDCAVEPAGVAGRADPLPARVVFASIHLAHGDPRLTGAALHELGHALGFQGHPRPSRRVRSAPRRPSTVMGRDTEEVRLAGERVLAGRPFADAALSALYAVPSGAVLTRLTPADTEPVDRMLRLGQQRRLIGPLVRVGDDEGRVAWLDPGSGAAASVRLLDLAQARTRPERLRIELSPGAQHWLREAEAER